MILSLLHKPCGAALFSGRSVPIHLFFYQTYDRIIDFARFFLYDY